MKNFPIVTLRTIPFLVHWITARGLAVAVQLNVALSGDTTVRSLGGVVITGTTVVQQIFCIFAIMYVHGNYENYFNTVINTEIATSCLYKK